MGWQVVSIAGDRTVDGPDEEGWVECPDEEGRVECPDEEGWVECPDDRDRDQAKVKVYCCGVETKKSMSVLVVMLT